MYERTHAKNEEWGAPIGRQNSEAANSDLVGQLKAECASSRVTRTLSSVGISCAGHYVRPYHRSSRIYKWFESRRITNGLADILQDRPPLWHIIN